MTHFTSKYSKNNYFLVICVWEKLSLLSVLYSGSKIFPCFLYPRKLDILHLYVLRNSTTTQTYTDANAPGWPPQDPNIYCNGMRLNHLTRSLPQDEYFIVHTAPVCSPDSSWASFSWSNSYGPLLLDDALIYKSK